ncbi:hypothetical protein STEG23_028279 [Scotinomys teguina]
MARKAGQGEEEKVDQSQEAKREKTPVRHEEKKPACHRGAHHVVEQDKCSAHPSSRKLVFATDGDHYRKLQKICKVVEPGPNGYIYKTVPAPNVEGTLQKKECGKTARDR